MNKIESEGILLILSSPSGAGKTTIAQAINNKDDNTELSISYTTRAIRPGEVHDKDYYFVDKENFLHMVNEKKFLEHAMIYDNLYGTPEDKILDLIHSGKDVIFDIDWQGAASITKQLPEYVVSIFILPPSLEILRARLESRQSGSINDVDKRFKEAVSEIEHYIDYDFVVVNDNLNHVIEEVHNILKSERLRRVRQRGLSRFITSL